MEQMQMRGVRNCAYGGSCPVHHLPFPAAPSTPEGSSPVNSGLRTPGNDSGCGRSGRSSASNLSAEQEGSQIQSGAAALTIHQSVVGEMSSLSSDGTFHTTYSGDFLMPPTSVSSYNTVPSMPSSLDPLSRQNSERPISLHRSLTPIGEESSRGAMDAAFQTAHDSLSHPVQLLPDVEESVKSMNQLGHYGTTPLPSSFPEQEIVYPLNPVSVI